IQRMLTEEQVMTVQKPVKREAYAAAETAVAVAKGKPIPRGLVNRRTDNGRRKVPSVIIEPVAVTRANIEDTVIKDDFWKVREICTRSFDRACRAAGIS